jgi:hypothetical protein
MLLEKAVTRFPLPVLHARLGNAFHARGDRPKELEDQISKSDRGRAYIIVVLGSVHHPVAAFDTRGDQQSVQQSRPEDYHT